MDVTNAIIEFGTEGVRRYREISQAKHDNELPEVFLGGFIASRLYDRFHCQAHVERYYRVIARELGIELNNDLLTELGGLRADIAIYRDGLPLPIIELKIFDERRQAASIADDLRKAEKLASRGNLRAYVGVMICETANPASGSLEIRTRKIHEATARKVYTGEPCRSVDGKWNWCFGCAELGVPSA